jgi:glutaredoxin
MMHVTIYSKPGCHLCEDVEAMVRQVHSSRRDFELEIRNILDDPAEMEAYQYAIPVITLNGREIARYRLTEKAFETELRKAL